ncbi:DUF3995 domain-containing protein [Phenylobacterium sp.]|uniref:DUF3995 domain-containing protein n=1 Tax=Phenylobacterium sp. TaxID=1871053 RepID=UPI0027368F6A|nr:DUF3995 domain-containing protein [Phenylobacterium sp.]MDP3660843.1 DUF3995 domain-containing protein [Phenylobacterium sp.]
MGVVLGVLLASVFAVLSLTHVYWAMGGQHGKAAAVPQVDGVATFRPSRAGTLLVAVALMGAAALLGALAGVLPTPVPHWILAFAAIGLALVLLARAIGDFKLVGFFKRPNGSRFARLDTLFYSPLCLVLGIGVASLMWIERSSL